MIDLEKYLKFEIRKINGLILKEQQLAKLHREELEALRASQEALHSSISYLSKAIVLIAKNSESKHP